MESIFSNDDQFWTSAITLSIILVGFCLGIWLIKDIFLQQFSCVCQTEAEVMGYKDITYKADGDNEILYFCQYRYFVDEKMYVETSRIADSLPILKVGEHFMLKYNPKNPHRHYIIDSNYSQTIVGGALLFIVLGGIGFIAACFGSESFHLIF